MACKTTLRTSLTSVGSCLIHDDQCITPPRSTEERKKLQVPCLADNLIIDGMREVDPMLVAAAEKRLQLMTNRIWANNPPLAAHFMRYCDLTVSMTTFFHPEVTLDQFVAMSVIYAYTFLIDDIFDATPKELTFQACGIDPAGNTDRTQLWEFLKRLDELIRPQTELQAPAAGTDSTPMERIVWEAGREMERTSSPEFVNVFVDELLVHHRHYVNMHGMEFWKDDGRDLVDAYCEFRAVDSGGLWAVLFVEFANHELLTDEVRTHPFTVEATKVVCAHVGLVNDMFSYGKEVGNCGEQWNFLTLLMNRDNIPLVEAIWRTIEIVNSFHRQFEELEKRLESWEPIEGSREALVRHFTGMRAFLVGNIHWSTFVTRYRSVHSPFLEMREVLFPDQMLQRASA